ncbi:PREDICTED: uncharacterized protein LOC108779837 [Cyphomyrmex costatus]|uniref:Uncharacterized protein n=1 Tax=Cyphomyrmex costatus TaxID=456900 RepID=A0A195C5Q3_9HYME|nr:PREDICTED: uncharacterized protein LOC108779837 [Cyphomyrmex costatus]KYM95960.1 hypothetical protein ALC62_13408 [Cyphomyrmex costatus]
MIVRHGTLWAIAVLVLLASVSFSESVKLRKPRKRTTARTPYQQSRIGSVIIKVMHKYSDDDLTRSAAAAGCTNGNCKNAHNKFNFEPINEAISEKDNFLSDEESLRYVVHPEKYEHFVLRKNTGHANRYKRDSTFSELHSSSADDRTVINRNDDASKVSENVSKGNLTKKTLYRLPLYRTHSIDELNRYAKNFAKSLSEANRTRRSFAADNSPQRSDDHSGHASIVSENVNEGNVTKKTLYRLPLYRIHTIGKLNRYPKNLAKPLSEANRTRRSFAADHSSQGSDASIVSENVSKGNFTKKTLYRLPLYRTHSLDELNRYTKNLAKPLNEANRTRRSFAADNSPQRSDDHCGNTSIVSENVNEGNVTEKTLYRLPLYRTHSLDELNRYTKNLAKPLSEANRMRRRLVVDYSSRRNDSDYYAQRKAVMDRYYARQREINALYANRTITTPRLKYNNVSQHLYTSNATLFNLGRAYPSRNSTARDSTTTFLHPSTMIDPIYSNESRYNRIPNELDSRRNFVSEIDPGFKSDTNLSQTRSSANSERNALDFPVTPTPCTNNGTFAPKTRSRHAHYNESNEDCPHNSTDKDNTEGSLRWGKCEGKIVYQHNLLLGLTGPSNLDALFEVVIQGPVCITCVEALRYNETRAVVALDSGGRGYEYAKLKLQGYENEGFSYIIKVWGINKIGEVCDNVD